MGSVGSRSEPSGAPHTSHTSHTSDPTRGERTVSKILVMDDDASVRELCSMVLGGEGHAVLEAADARAGIAQAETERPDLILLDWMMPEVDGLDALQVLQSAETTSEMP